MALVDQDLSFEEMDAMISEMERRKGLDSLYYFDKHILGYKDMELQPHQQVCEFVQDESRDTQQLKKHIELPRGSFKSSVITIGYTIWKLAKNPNLRVLIDNEVYGNSKAFLRELKGHLEKEEVLRLYPQLAPNKLINDGWTESSVIVKGRTRSMKEPSISCSGIDMIKVGMHYDVIIMDDLVSPRNCTTKEQMEKVVEHYKLALSLLEPNGLLILVGTRYHYSDLYGYIMENEPEIFKHLVLPAILENGELLFPKRLTRQFLEEIKDAQGTYIFNCQYMLDPVDEETAEFKKEWIRYYDGEYIIENGRAFLDIRKVYDHNKIELRELKPVKHPVEVYTTMDPASKKKKKSDWSTLITNGVTPEYKWFILDIARDKLNPKERVDILFDSFEKWRPKLTGIEEVGFQDTIRFYAIEKMRETGIFFRIQALSTGNNKKEDRILGLQPRFETHSVYLPRKLIKKCYDAKSYNMIEEFLTEYAFFPLAKHDDLMDCLAYQIQIVPNKRTKGHKRRQGKSQVIGR